MTNKISEITPDIIMGELNEDYFKKYHEDINRVLISIYSAETFDEQIEESRKSLGAFWENYYSKNIADVLNSFPKIQRALFGLEEDYSSGSRYRDHYVHMFNVFITGSRIISKIEQLSEKTDEFASIFKVQSEPTTIPFEKPYNEIERLFFLWVLISTFHDIGIPIEHLDKIKDGINSFIKFFGLKIDSIVPVKDHSLIDQVGYFIDHMARFKDISVIPKNGVYIKNSKPSNYLKQCLLKEFSKNNHGVISAICLFNSFIETFLIGHHHNPKYDLSKEEYDNFITDILEQDVARAALAIAYHNINYTEYPKIFPIDPKKLPLTFLLILCDEIQEAFRHEGINYLGISKLNTFPVLDVLKIAPEKFSIAIAITYFELTVQDEESVLSQLYNYSINAHKINSITTFQELISFTWANIFKVLENKLQFSGGPFEVTINVYYNQASKNQSMLICNKSF